MEYTKKELELIHMNGYLSKPVVPAQDGIIRWLDDGQKIKLLEPQFTSNNVKFIVDAPGQEVWYSQLSEILFDADGDCYTGSLFLKNKERKFIYEIEAFDFADIVANKVFKVQVSQPLLKVNKKNSSFNHCVKLGECINYIIDCFKKKEFDKTKGLYLTSHFYDLHEV